MNSKHISKIGGALLGLAIPYALFSYIYGDVTFHQLKSERQTTAKIEKEVGESEGAEKVFFTAFAPARQVAYQCYLSQLNLLNQNKR